ncbi:MAG: hypothetical protein KME60_12065 [Cyanomargarita calcarea GSE-NOS-MK-12-04C]|uniref:Uncharacterized protein n=1 Tax=Cyanomargarita calcarea GSE-NOS-MK-12-04C TaxID=2839659 RepID=A0A951USU6_9CYAN|nr:hypothetical protein [Cyanomargarita calcarea GSE-NOS-MK-12-04C]
MQHEAPSPLYYLEEEAAALDLGATPVQAFTLVLLPQLSLSVACFCKALPYWHHPYRPKPFMKDFPSHS